MELAFLRHNYGRYPTELKMIRAQSVPGELRTTGGLEPPAKSPSWLASVIVFVVLVVLSFVTDTFWDDY